MTKSHTLENQIQYVSNFEELVLTPFTGSINAICWKRDLAGDFSEIVEKINLNGNLTEIDVEELLELQLSEKGQKAREILLHDLNFLKEQGALPSLNCIKHYDRDDFYPFFPTDVYSFHVDRSPIPTSTYLCTYLGASSDILPNSCAEQKILIPEIRAELKKLYDGPEAGFDAFLTDNFFDLHYQKKHEAVPINLGTANVWKLAVDHPESKVLPCIHRAPKENDGEKRLLLIC